MVPLYVVAPRHARGDALVSALPQPVTRFASVQEIGPLDERDAGIILVAGEADTDPWLPTLVHEVSRDERPWRVGVMEVDDWSTVRSLSLGPSVQLDDLVTLLRDVSDSPPDVLTDVKSVLRRVAEVRHRLNNELTAALAEAQLLMLDPPDEESRDSFQIILDQLQSLRGAIADLSIGRYRAPRERGNATASAFDRPSGTGSPPS